MALLVWRWPALATQGSDRKGPWKSRIPGIEVVQEDGSTLESVGTEGGKRKDPPDGSDLEAD